MEEEKREEKVEVAPKPKKSTKQRIEEKEVGKINDPAVPGES